MEEVKIGTYLIEVDRKRTKEYYSSASTIEQLCSCTYCQNFSAAYKLIPGEVAQLFEQLGVELNKATEVYENSKKANGLHSYGSFYYLVGKIKNSDILPKAEEADSKKLAYPIELVSICEGHLIGFTDNICLKPENISQPILQLEAGFELPWVLDQLP